MDTLSSSSSRRLPTHREILLLSFKPRLFPDLLFEVDTVRMLRDEAGRIFRAALRGDIPGMKTLAKSRSKEGKILEVMEEIRDTQNRILGALHVAAYAGQPGLCKYLTKTLRLDANAAARHGSSPLICAIYAPKPKRTVEILLNRGADPNIEGGTEKFTVLHVLVTKNKQDLVEIAEILLSRGANVDSMSKEGTPLHFAAQCGNAGMVKALLKHGANPNSVKRSFAPLTLALFASSLNCVKLLIEAGADVNAGGHVTPLIIAAADGLADCIQCLLEASADPNILDEIGRVPVEIAAIHGWKKCVDILFPFTSPVARFADWSVDGIMQHMTSGSSEGNLHKSEEKVAGDAAFKRKDYTHACALYTKAMETDPKDSTLYAKRSLCWLRMGEKDKAVDDADTCKGMIKKEKALDDANTCKAIGRDVSNCCPEQEAALISREDYGQASEALISSLKLDSGSGPVGEVSREEDK